MWDYEQWGLWFDPHRLSRKMKKKRGENLMFKNLSHSPHLKQRWGRHVHCKVTPIPNSRRRYNCILAGNLIGVPDIIWEICRVWWGENAAEIEFRRRKFEIAFIAQHFFCLFPHKTLIVFQRYRGIQSQMYWPYSATPIPYRKHASIRNGNLSYAGLH